MTRLWQGRCLVGRCQDLVFSQKLLDVHNVSHCKIRKYVSRKDAQSAKGKGVTIPSSRCSPCLGERMVLVAAEGRAGQEYVSLPIDKMVRGAIMTVASVSHARIQGSWLGGKQVRRKRIATWAVYESNRRFVTATLGMEVTLCWFTPTAWFSSGRNVSIQCSSTALIPNCEDPVRG